MTNGINKLFFENVKLSQINIVKNYLEDNGWNFGDITTCYGEDDNCKWYHIGFYKGDDMITINIGMDYNDNSLDENLNYFYEGNHYSGNDDSNKFIIYFNNLNDWEYNFHKLFKYIINNK